MQPQFAAICEISRLSGRHKHVYFFAWRIYNYAGGMYAAKRRLRFLRHRENNA
jgi:hypothetical protein